MHISSVQVQNYKCFLDSGKIALIPGFNVFVGRNDSGKSAFVEALSLRLGSKPHRSLRSLPTADSLPVSASTTLVTYRLSGEDMVGLLARLGEFYVPGNPGGDLTAETLSALLTKDQRLVATWTDGAAKVCTFESLGKSIDRQYVHITNRSAPSGLNLRVRGRISGDITDIGIQVATILRERSYAFRAERMNVGECGINGSPNLEPNASNLPDVLNQLSSTNPVRYERLMAHVRTIFPHITQVTAPIFGNKIVRILVWSVPLETERADLAVPLAESGTGIGQVLAILYVVVTSDSPKVLIIDEPQSFLHPGAVRKLLEILRSYPQHQYVITTHAPVALNTGRADRLLLVRRGEHASTVVPIDPNSQDDLRTFLAEVGARLGDVFGADSILWVEGKTEEICFPELIRRLANTPLRGVQVLGVISTDELGAKFANRVYDIYVRLAGGATLLPPAAAFVFDREGRSATEREDIDRKSKGLVHWLPRRMYENYLLDPSAISGVLNGEDAGRAAPITADDVSAWMERKKTDSKYRPPSDEQSNQSAGWQEQTHGARVLQDLFGEMTEQRLQYDKVRHGLMLTFFLIEHPTPEISGLAKMLGELVALRGCDVVAQ